MWKGDRLIIPRRAVVMFCLGCLGVVVGLGALVAALFGWANVLLPFGLGMVGGGWMLYQAAMRTIQEENE